MATLDEYVRWGDEDIASLTARFLHSFMMNSPLLKTYEVDNFILKNGKVLCSWYVLLAIVVYQPYTTISIWQLYEVRHPSLSNVRASLLLRVLVVDVVPFRELLTETFSTLSTWESRSV